MDDVRIGLFIDYENLAIGAREDLSMTFDFGPIADALAERGRVVVRRAYADWSRFQDDRRMLTDNHVELIEIPQRRGAVRKNAADIKMAVDAVELAFEREITSQRSYSVPGTPTFRPWCTSFGSSISRSLVLG